MPDTHIRSDRTAEWRKMPVVFDAGPGALARIGLVCLDTDQVIQEELRAFLAVPGIALLGTRIAYGRGGSPEALAAMEARIPNTVDRIMPGEALDMVIYGCTAGAMTIGPERIEAAVHRARPGILVTDPVSAAVRALRHLGAERIALLTPYVDRVNAVVGRFFEGQGFELVERGSFKCETGAQIGLVPPEAILEAGVALAREDCDALFVSCAGLRVSPVLQQLEDGIGKPVVASNQALAWDCLRRLGIDRTVDGFGRLLAG